MPWRCHNGQKNGAQNPSIVSMIPKGVGKEGWRRRGAPICKEMKVGMKHWHFSS